MYCEPDNSLELYLKKYLALPFRKKFDFSSDYYNYNSGF